MSDVHADSGIDNLFAKYKKNYNSRQPEGYSLAGFFEIARNDRLAYATAAERMLKAIGEPTIVDTALDPRLSRIHSNKTNCCISGFSRFLWHGRCCLKCCRLFPESRTGA